MVAGTAGNVLVSAQDLVEEEQPAELDPGVPGATTVVVVGVADGLGQGRRLGRDSGRNDPEGAGRKHGEQVG
jgi:hypothetical protein